MTNQWEVKALDRCLIGWGSASGAGVQRISVVRVWRWWWECVGPVSRTRPVTTCCLSGHRRCSPGLSTAGFPPLDPEALAVAFFGDLIKTVGGLTADSVP